MSWSLFAPGTAPLAMTAPLQPQYYAADWLLPVSAPPVRGGFLVVSDGKIVETGALSDLTPSVRETLPPVRPGSLIAPGFVNTHLHLEQSFPEMIRKSPDESFESWLLQVIKRNMAEGSPEAKAIRCRSGAGELLETGTTCVNDICSGPEAFTALDEAGLRGVVSPEFFHPGFEEPLQLERAVSQYESLSARFEGHPRLRVGLSPHSAYNVSPAAWRRMLEVCRPPLVHSHLAEFADETRYLAGEAETLVHRLHQRVLGRTFTPEAPMPSPTEYLHHFGLLSHKLVVAHCLHTSLTDRIHFAGHRVAVAHCPRSNVNLHGRTLDWRDWAETALDFGLGTDGRLSTEDLDLRAEARFAMGLHDWSAKEALQIMTRGGAAVLELEERIGSLDAGKAADFVRWQAAGETETPEEALLAPDTIVEEVLTDGVSRYARS